MSEEILKALMQLFAIIAKQDNILIENHEKFVVDFLSSQLSVERVDEYLTIYKSFLNETKPENPEADVKEKSRTSMKDSVRTLSICKKINKTLAQKQKIIVLIRLLEFFKNDSHQSFNRNAIVETVADVFKIEKAEFKEIREFIFEPEHITSANEVVIGEDSKSTQCVCLHYVPFHNYHGLCKFIHIKSINLVTLKYHGNIELFLNGIVIKPESIYLFPHGSTLRLPQTTIYYSNVISKFTQDQVSSPFSFYAEITEHKFPNGTKALNELKISETSGHLVGIMGASGSGKTTLLTLLSGQEIPSNGKLAINDIDMHSKNNDLKGIIGYVPQDDLLLEDLTVYQNLYYNARLCFKDLDEKEINLKISRTMISLGLNEIKDIKVGSPMNKKISGGQRKRLNIALELLREPHILFLDEPTSGLSSRDSDNVMDLLKEITFKGKLIFVVIHQPSSDIFKMFDKIMILDTGGYPAYYGNPIESVMYFKKVTNQINSEVGECYACGSVNPETIFNLMELKEIDEYGNYTATRKITPAKFYELYKEKFYKFITKNTITGKISSEFNIPTKLTQTKYFFLRDLFSKLSNKQYILINLLEVPTLVLFLSLIIRYIDKSKNSEYSYHLNYNIPAYFFMAVIVALLVGLTISAEEIFKDQKILKREKFLHLSRLSYILSKITLLFIISFLQSILFVLIGNFVLQINGNYFHFFLIIISIFCYSNLFGLILSSTFNSPVTIYIIIPLIIIPQMLLGGAMFNYNKLNELFGGGHKVPVVANFMVSRWAYEAMAVDMYINNKYEKERFIYDKIESELNYKLVYLFPKMDELILTNDALHPAESKLAMEIVKKEIIANQAKDIKLGFVEPLPNLTNKADVHDYLKKLKSFYDAKLINVINLKEIKIDELIKLDKGKLENNRIKSESQNNQLEETVTASLEKEKIAVEDGRLIQIIDPIFKEPSESNKFFGLNAHFYSPIKYLFNNPIPTFYFNLIVIWIINFLAFLALYYDVLKLVINKFS